MIALVVWNVAREAPCCSARAAACCGSVGRCQGRQRRRRASGSRGPSHRRRKPLGSTVRAAGASSPGRRPRQRRHRKGRDGASSPPPAVRSPPTEPAPAAREVDVSLARRLEGLRDTARRQFGRGENQQGLTTLRRRTRAGARRCRAAPDARRHLERGARRRVAGAVVRPCRGLGRRDYGDVSRGRPSCARCRALGAERVARRSGAGLLDGFGALHARGKRGAAPVRPAGGAGRAAPVAAARDTEEPRSTVTPPAAPIAVAPPPAGRSLSARGCRGRAGRFRARHPRLTSLRFMPPCARMRRPTPLSMRAQCGACFRRSTSRRCAAHSAGSDRSRWRSRARRLR